MAQTYINTGTQAGNFEDLINVITQVAYEETPFLSSCGRARAKGIKHEWMTEALRAGTSNAQAEGRTYTFAAANNTVRTRVSNQVQIVDQPFSASNTQDVVNKAGIGEGSEYDHQKAIKTKELALDIDYVLINSTTVTRDADAGTASQMTGALSAISTCTRNANSALLTEDLYNQLTQLMWTKGSKPDTIFCCGPVKRVISGWAQPFRDVSNGDTTYSNTVEVYKGDWFVQKIVPDVNMPTTSIMVLEMKYWNVAYLRPLEHKELPVTGDYRGGVVRSELTLEYLNERAGGTITNLAALAS